jgi:hypothetical protein
LAVAGISRLRRQGSFNGCYLSPADCYLLKLPAACYLPCRYVVPLPALQAAGSS